MSLELVSVDSKSGPLVGSGAAGALHPRPLAAGEGTSLPLHSALETASDLTFQQARLMVDPLDVRAWINDGSLPLPADVQQWAVKNLR